MQSRSFENEIYLQENRVLHLARFKTEACGYSKSWLVKLIYLQNRVRIKAFLGNAAQATFGLMNISLPGAHMINANPVMIKMMTTR